MELLFTVTKEQHSSYVISEIQFYQNLELVRLSRDERC